MRHTEVASQSYSSFVKNLWHAMLRDKRQKPLWEVPCNSYLFLLLPTMQTIFEDLISIKSNTVSHKIQ